MNEFQATAVMIGLFALRCVVPLLMTAALGYLMNRLVDRWEAEDERQMEMATAEPKPEVVTAVPATKKPSLPALPCWLTRKCDPARRDNCPAYQHRATPCWATRQQFEGTLPADCPGCPIYQQAHA